MGNLVYSSSNDFVWFDITFFIGNFSFKSYNKQFKKKMFLK